LLTALAASLWLARHSPAAIWFLWLPVPALIAWTYARIAARRRVAAAVVGVLVCVAGIGLILWGWFLYIPAGLILLVAAAVPDRTALRPATTLPVCWTFDE
jgi:hypothetical protein